MRARIDDVRPAERRAFALSAALFFAVLFSYYLIRGLRDELGVRQGVEHLPRLWLVTALASLALHPVVGWAVARLPRRTFIPLAFRGALACVLATFLVLTRTAAEGGAEPGAAWLWTARAFYVGVSVWAMLATSIFWSLMADVWRAEQGKRLFGLVATGGTLGGIAGAGLLAVASLLTNPMYALLACAAALEVCARLGRRVVRLADADPHSESGSGERIGGSVWAGVGEVASSPYLIAMAAYLLLITLGNAFIYQQTSAILDAQIADTALRTSIFGWMDVSVNVLTLVGQGWLAARITRRFGAGLLLAGMPLLCVGGFAALVFWPIVPVVVAFSVLQRTGRYALTRPGRALLFTVVPRAERYKAQNFLDVVVYRFGDAGSAMLYDLALLHPLPGLAAGVPATAAVVAPACVATAVAAFALGRWFEARAGRKSA
jgi:AAA family ATP:ADP antiporter